MNQVAVVLVFVAIVISVPLISILWSQTSPPLVAHDIYVQMEKNANYSNPITHHTQAPLQPPAQPMTSKQRRVTNFDANNTINGLMIPPTIPALIIVGPAKTGTSSLTLNLNQYIDLVSHGEEHHYWTHGCHSDLSIDEWTQFIDDFTNPAINATFSSIANKFIYSNNDTRTFVRNKAPRCNLDFFYTNWMDRRTVKNKHSCWHGHLLLGNDSNNMNNFSTIVNIVNHNYNHNYNYDTRNNSHVSISDIFSDKTQYTFYTKVKFFLNHV